MTNYTKIICYRKIFGQFLGIFVEKNHRPFRVYVPFFELTLIITQITSVPNIGMLVNKISAGDYASACSMYLIASPTVVTF